MVTLYGVLKQAETEGVAIGHFNVSDLVTLKAEYPKANGNSWAFGKSPRWSRAYARNTISPFS